MGQLRGIGAGCGAHTSAPFDCAQGKTLSDRGMKKNSFLPAPYPPASSSINVDRALNHQVLSRNTSFLASLDNPVLLAQLNARRLQHHRLI